MKLPRVDHRFLLAIVNRVTSLKRRDPIIWRHQRVDWLLGRLRRA